MEFSVGDRQRSWYVLLQTPAQLQAPSCLLPLSAEARDTVSR